MSSIFVVVLPHDRTGRVNSPGEDVLGTKIRAQPKLQRFAAQWGCERAENHKFIFFYQEVELRTSNQFLRFLSCRDLAFTGNLGDSQQAAEREGD